MPQLTKNCPTKTSNSNSDGLDKNNNKSSRKNKRNRTPVSPTQTSPELVQPSKMPANISTDNELLQTLSNLFNTQRNEIRNDLQNNVSSIQQEIKTMVDEFKIEFRAELNTVKENVCALSASVDQRFDQINDQLEVIRIDEEHKNEEYKRILRANELKIVGVIYYANENPLGIFNLIASIIGYNTSTSPQPTVIRVFKRQGTEHTPQKILIIKFVAAHLRDEFYSSYLHFLSNKQMITGDLIKLGSRSDKITIGENLTPLNHKIFKECMSLKRNGFVAQVFTWNGITKVKIDKSSRAVVIKSQRELDIFIVNNNFKMNSSLNNANYQRTLNQ